MLWHWRLNNNVLNSNYPANTQPSGQFFSCTASHIANVARTFVGFLAHKMEQDNVLQWRPSVSGVLRQDAYAAMVSSDFCCLRNAATTTITGLSISWCCPSMIYAVFLCDEYHLLFPVVLWFLAAYGDGRHGRTRIICDEETILGVYNKMDLLVPQPWHSV